MIFCNEEMNRSVTPRAPATYKAQISCVPRQRHTLCLFNGLFIDYTDPARRYR